MLERLAVIFAGGCVGGYARYAVSQAWPSATYAFPWSTFTVNLVGSFVLGVVVVLATNRRGSRQLRLLVGTGFCGALTTYSTFGYETLHLAMRGDRAGAWWNIGISTFVGVAAAGHGWSLGTALSR